MWWSFYWFTIAASGQLVNWTLPGFIVLTMVFFGSSRLAESISLSKYPSYANYQRVLRASSRSLESVKSGSQPEAPGSLVTCLYRSAVQ